MFLPNVCAVFGVKYIAKEELSSNNGYHMSDSVVSQSQCKIPSYVYVAIEMNICRDISIILLKYLLNGDAECRSICIPFVALQM